MEQISIVKLKLSNVEMNMNEVVKNKKQIHLLR